MPDSEVLTTTFATLVGIILGYLLSIWRNRLQPWITVMRISESRRAADRMEVSSELIDNTANSWFTGKLIKDRVYLDDLSTCYDVAVRWLQINRTTDESLEKCLTELTNSSSGAQAIGSVRELLRMQGFSDMLALAISRGVVLPPAFDPNAPTIHEFYFDDQSDEGCFKIDMGDALLRFGDNLAIKSTPPTRNKIERFVELVAREEHGKLLAVLNQMPPIIAEQRSIHGKIQDEAKHTVEAHSRWTTIVNLSNFGSTSFIVFPESAHFVIKGPRMKPRRVEARLLSKGETSWIPIDGVLVVEPNKALELALVTKEVQNRIPDGTLIRGLYQGKRATLRCEINARGRELPWTRRVKSNRFPFTERPDQDVG